MLSAKKIAYTLLAAGFITGSLGLTILPRRASAPVKNPAPPTVLPKITSNPLVGAGQQPSTRIVFSSSPENPLAARDAGYRVISELQIAGKFDDAASYALTGPEAFRTDLLIAAYHEWGRHEPEVAFVSASRIDDPAAHETALQAALSGWARTDPESLAELAIERPDGPEKTAALTKAMRAWLNKDPDKAGDWIAAHESAIPIAEKMFRDDRR